MTPFASVSPGVKSGCFQLSMRREHQHKEWAPWGAEAKQGTVRMVQAHRCAPDVAPITLQAKHCAKLEVETLIDLEVRGIFFLSWSSAFPYHVIFRHPLPGILWALNPVFVAVFNYYPEVLELRGESVSAVFFSSSFPIGQKMVPSLNNLNVQTLIPTLDLFLYH